MINKKDKTFYDKVYSFVRKIPKGKVSTYEIVADHINSRAYRAVGTALHKNPYREVPCHRVVNSNGEVGGFARGVNKKISLLRKEGIKIKGKKIVNLERYLFNP